MQAGFNVFHLARQTQAQFDGWYLFRGGRRNNRSPAKRIILGGPTCPALSTAWTSAVSVLFACSFPRCLTIAFSAATSAALCAWAIKRSPCKFTRPDPQFYKYWCQYFETAIAARSSV
jgi:hypothetical protein